MTDWNHTTESNAQQVMKIHNHRDSHRCSLLSKRWHCKTATSPREKPTKFFFPCFFFFSLFFVSFFHVFMVFLFFLCFPLFSLFFPCFFLFSPLLLFSFLFFLLFFVLAFFPLFSFFFHVFKKQFFQFLFTFFSFCFCFFHCFFSRFPFFLFFQVFSCFSPCFHCFVPFFVPFYHFFSFFFVFLFLFSHFFHLFFFFSLFPCLFFSLFFLPFFFPFFFFFYLFTFFPFFPIFHFFLFFSFFCGKNMLDVFVIPRCMMSTWPWSRPETNVCLETTCRHTVTFATKVCCDRTLFKAKFLFGLVLSTLPAESETHNALVVVVCSVERSTRSTQRITERDTAQTERILTILVITARPDSRSVSSHEKRNNIAQHPCTASVPSCVGEPRVARTHSVVPEPTLRAW